MRRILIILILVLISIPLTIQLVTGVPPVQSQTINPDNITDLQFVERYGQGSLNNTLDFSPVDDRIVVGGTRGIYLYDNIDAEPEFIELFREDGVAMNVTSVLWSPDAEMIFAGTDDEYLIGLFEDSVLVDHEEIIAYNLSERRIVYRLAGNAVHDFSSDGSMLVYQMEIGFDVADIRTGEVVHEVRGEQNQKGMLFPATSRYNRWVLTDAQFTPDDSGLYVDFDVSRADLYDEYSGVLDLDDVSRPRSLRATYDYLDDVDAQSYSFTFDGNAFALSGQGIVTQNGTQQILPDGQTFQHAFYIGFSTTMTPDRRVIAAPYGYSVDSPVENFARYFDVAIWDIETKTLRGIIEQPEAWWENAYRQDAPLRLSRDARYLAIGTTIYDVNSGDIVRRLYGDEYTLLTGSQNLLLHYAPDNHVHVLDSSSMQEVSTLSVPRNFMLQVDQLENGNLRVSRNFDERNQYAILQIAPETGDILSEIQFEFIDYIQQSSGARYVYYGNSRYVITSGQVRQLWDLWEGTPIELPQSTRIIAPFFTADGAAFLENESDNEVGLYYPASSRYVTVPVPEDNGDDPTTYSFSDDGRIIAMNVAINDDNRQIMVWDVHHDPPQLLLEASTVRRSTGIAVSQDGVYVAYMSGDRTIEVLQIDTGELISSNTGLWNPGSTLEFVGMELLVDPYMQGPRIWVVLDAINGENMGVYNRGDYPPEDFLLDTGDMQFYLHSRTLLEIMASDGLTLHEIDLERGFSSVILSEDSRSLWIEFDDGTVELWSIP